MMATITKIGSNVKHPKDHTIWAKWSITIPKCKGCQTPNAVLTIVSPLADAQTLANDQTKHYCDKCSC